MAIKNKEIGLISSTVFALGVFFPVIRTPFGSLGFFSNVKALLLWEGLLFLLFAVCIGYSFFKEKFEKAKLLTILATIFLVIEFVINKLRICLVKKELVNELKDNQFVNTAKNMLGNLGLSWAWLFLILGVIGMLYASFKKTSKGKVVNNSNKKEVVKPAAKKVETKKASSNTKTKTIAKKPVAKPVTKAPVKKVAAKKSAPAKASKPVATKAPAKAKPTKAKAKKK